MIDTGRAARRFMDLKPSGYGPSPDWGRHTVVVNGFTGSPVWDAIYAFPPATQDFFEEGYGRFADQWLPILEEFDQEDVVFGLEVHPTEIAFDTVTMRRALEALAYHERFKINYDPSHLGWQRVNYVSFLLEFSDRIAHVHMKDAAWGLGNGESGVNGSHLDFGSPGRWWDFKSVGRGMIDFTAIIEVLNAIGYRGPLSVEWEHAGMDRVFGATEACTKVRELDFPISEVAFDAAMAEQGEAANA